MKNFGMAVYVFQKFLGSAPAPGAVWRASRQTRKPLDAQMEQMLLRHLNILLAKRSTGGAPNDSRGGCAPHSVEFAKNII
jgi:hypothetical protein